jgi:hypothetical protein
MVLNSTAVNNYLINNNNKRVIQKSQQFFKDKVDNSYLPFVPKIRCKPNGLKQLPEIFSRLDQIDINDKLYEQYPEL